jgi:hypothetical protein
MKELMESAIYQEMVRDTRIKTSQEGILVFLEARFDQISEEIKLKLSQIQSTDTLKVLTKSAATVHSLEEFEKLL